MTKFDINSLPPPIPAKGHNEYNRRLEERFNESPFARANYLRYKAWKMRGGSTDVDFLPFRAHVSPNSQCNFMCNMCAVTEFPNGKRADRMSREDFSNIIQQLPALIEFSPVGLSEIAMMPRDDLIYMLELVRSQKIWTKIATNASLLHKNDLASYLQKIDIDEIVISIDGVTARVFESIRLKSNFEQVLRNTKNFINLYQSTDKNPVKIQVTLQAKNIHQLNDFVPFAAEIGVRNIQFSIDLVDWGSKDIRNWKIFGDSIEIPAIDYSALIEQGVNNGVYVGFVRNKKYSSKHNDTLCPWPFTSTMITSDNMVVPCCKISNPDFYNLGKLDGYNSVSEVWTSNVYQLFRKAHLDGNVPEICRQCYV